MVLQQLEYIVAVDTHRHFLRAAESCYITQATLSMMIKKLEEELDTIIFDRSKQPVVPTDVGEKIIAQARRILGETAKMKELVSHERGQLSGELRLGIIPTIAPYLLPMIVKTFTTLYPKINLYINEFTTNNIIEKLKTGQIDVGILATPLKEKTITEHPLYYEKFFLYVNTGEKGYDKQFVLPKNIDIDRLWLLEEGHCMRAQILNLCELKRQNALHDRLHYEAGSIETLMNLVDQDYGITIIPELKTLTMTEEQKKQLRYFKPPTPVREISIVTHYEYVKERMVRALQNVITDAVPQDMLNNKKLNVVDI
ncbi:MAG: LysR substrate-binding domain-containing protein [Sphingobacteriales bacterium JAD_PAG50586_3]|nr:MAG: LysR substrate-binding domain-containing protein [Sphingobacteriales bacterium JAD_PAG50586_3]